MIFSPPPPFAPADAVLQPAARRILERCDLLARHTERPGEITRTYCSPAMQAAYAEVQTWGEAAGLNCRLDTAGNLFLRREAAAPTARTLLVGSHLDTVANAGRYDGVLGVMLGLGLVELLQMAAVQLPFAVEVVAFCEEEGVRYQTPYLGSRALVGDLPAELAALKDVQGIPLGDALRTFGGDPARWSECCLAPENVVAFLEPHIEQGPVLELENLPLGVVTGIAGQTRASFQFRGQAGHAGTVPMSARRDALAAAAQWISEVERIGRGMPDLVATVGQLQISPNVGNVIAGEVTARLDLRHLEDRAREAAFEQILQAAQRIAADRGLETQLLWTQHQPAALCDPRCAVLLEAAIAETGFSPLRLASGAGHDAVVMCRAFPTAMLFVRCAGGVSHHPAESVALDDVAAALGVMCRTIAKFAALEFSPS